MGFCSRGYGTLWGDHIGSPLRSLGFGSRGLKMTLGCNDIDAGACNIRENDISDLNRCLGIGLFDFCHDIHDFRFGDIRCCFDRNSAVVFAFFGNIIFIGQNGHGTRHDARWGDNLLAGIIVANFAVIAGDAGDGAIFECDRELAPHGAPDAGEIDGFHGFEYSSSVGYV